MSAENTIKNYLIDGKVDMLDNSTLDLLESTLLTEDYPIKIMSVIANVLGSVQDLSGLKMISAKKDMIIAGTKKSVGVVNSMIFDDDPQSEKDNPINQSPPKTKKEVDGYLRKIHKWLSSKIKIEYEILKNLFNKSYAFIIKALVGVGLVAPIAVTIWGGTGGTKGIGMASALLISGVVILIALLAVYLCIINAIEMSQGDEDKINFDQALTNIINGFKSLFTSLKIGKGEAKFASISAMLTVFLGLIYKVIPIEKYIKNILQWSKEGFVFFYDLAKKVGPIVIEPIKDFLKNRGVTASKEEVKKAATDIVNTVSEKSPKFKQLSSSLANMDKWVEKMTWFVKVIVVPFICFMVIIYLFAELVDRFNLEKIRKGEQGETEEEFI
jgi:hypothetical protein